MSSEPCIMYTHWYGSYSNPSSLTEWGGFGSHRGVFGKPPIPKGRPSLASNNGKETISNVQYTVT